MAWNQPENNGQDRDPWGKSRINPEGKNQRKNNQPSHDIDDLFREISNKIGGVGSSKFLTMIILLITILWISSGFYTIKEAERGVLTCFGKFTHLVQPGLNWKPTFIEQVQAVNVEAVRQLGTSGMMLTSDENVVRVEMNVQYRVIDPKKYLYSVTNADDSLRQATDSALRGVIGRSTMDRILTAGRTVVRSETQREIERTIRPYDMGIILLDVNFQTARPPEEVKAAFDDAIAALENREQYVREAEAYANEVQPRANGQAQRILSDARAYKERTILEAQGEITRFSTMLIEYKANPKIMKKRLYIESMERILSHTHKILINDSSNHLMVLPLDQFKYDEDSKKSKDISDLKKSKIIFPSSSHHADSNNILVQNSNIMDQRRLNALRKPNIKGEIR
ncbi:FtsH protease activity modulator HflK [Pantoea sp. Aalb]|uniref:FtsH protease activity modulator HflK n=1 Tax=Pantoea sp. Aalb TaxID=2576762 RepID=UPI0013282AB9|nr:FtsH protease activity modulator HflK [Pantoea sp. Aalb]MXP67679.1 FtsH protease activity modulator HflK [Pantoea sp. Aalb]